MRKCDKCGERIEDHSDSCWKCAGSPIGKADINAPVAVSVRRPTGITILAALNYFYAACSLVVGVVCLFGTKAMAALSSALDRLDKPEFAGTSWSPFQVASLALLAVALSYFLASGLWRLRNWARLVTVGFSVLDLINGGPSFLGPFNLLIPSGPGHGLLNRFFSFLLVLYLLSPGVRDAFDRTAPRRRWLLPAAAALGLISLSFDLYRSGPEIRAIRWHMRHGDHVSVNGVTFPVYTWYVPQQESDGADLRIEDSPGPLRSNDGLGFISIRGSRDDEGGFSVEQLVDNKIKGYQKSGYTDLNRFQLQIGKESLGCMRSTLVSNTIYCYGDGPIYSVFFAGGNRSLDRFTRMMADAR